MKRLILLLALLPGVADSTGIVRNPDGGILRSPKVLSEFQKLNPCPSTGFKKGACPGFVKDHIRPLCSGGHDEVTNLKWSEVGYSKLRDKEEWELCRALKRKYAEVTLDEPKEHLCNIIELEKLTLIQEICK
jgi:hypothetical protein